MRADRYLGIITKNKRRYMKVKEHTSRYKQTKIGEFRLNRSYTMNEDIMTGMTTDRKLVKFSIEWKKS